MTRVANMCVPSYSPIFAFALLFLSFSHSLTHSLTHSTTHSITHHIKDTGTDTLSPEDHHSTHHYDLYSRYLTGTTGTAQASGPNEDFYKNMVQSFHNKLSSKSSSSTSTSTSSSSSLHHKQISKLKENFKTFHDEQTRFFLHEEKSGNVIRSSSFPRKPTSKKQVLFLHFHKAGGTSICRYFKDAAWKVPEKFCICNEKISTAALFAHTRRIIHMRNFDKMFRKSESDICMFEKKWMKPHYFFQIRQIFTGYFVTALRRPWDRFRSNYEKDYSICSTESSNRKVKNMTIENYSKLNPRDCPKSYYLRTNTNRPNFYIRMLNGLSIEAYSFDGDGDGGLKVMTEYHLEQAKEVLMSFDVVLLLEDDPHHLNENLQKLTGIVDFGYIHVLEACFPF
jgi:hypothetical protein